MNIQIIKINSLNMPRGIYTDWMANALTDNDANALLAEGSAIITSIANPFKESDFQVPVSRTIALSTAYQNTDPSRSALYTVNITSASTMSLGGTVTNEGGIWIGSTNGVASGTGSRVGEYKNALGGAVVIGVNLSTTQAQPYTFLVPKGWYFAVRPTVGAISIVSAFEQPLK